MIDFFDHHLIHFGFQHHLPAKILDYGKIGFGNGNTSPTRISTAAGLEHVFETGDKFCGTAAIASNAKVLCINPLDKGSGQRVGRKTGNSFVERGVPELFKFFFGNQQRCG